MVNNVHSKSKKHWHLFGVNENKKDMIYLWDMLLIFGLEYEENCADKLVK